MTTGTTGQTERAFNGKVLNVNLSTGEITAEHLPDEMYRKYLGGYGLGARMLLDRVPKGADPLGPENMLGIFPGLMTGTPLFGQRYQAVCKSPLTGGWGDANCGGNTGPYLKHAGWDGVMFFGASEKPVYLLIRDDEVSIEDASDLWGKDAIETEKLLMARHGKKSSVADIGQAGETLSLISGICNDHGRLAARSGVGAVMGSKKLKAIVIVPSRNIMVQNKETLAEVKQGLQDFVKPTADFFRTYGTTGITSRSAHSGDSPVKNWGGVGIVDFPNVETITGDVVNATMEKHYACWHCPIACGAESKESENAEYPYPRHTHRPEYETMASFGTMNLNNNLDSLTYANHLCNAYGFDSISAGATVSFAIECYENGILTKEDTDGLELHWGDDKAIIKLLEMMGTRQGIGAVLADGVKVAAEKIGRGSEKFAMHVAGQELPMHDPKLQPEYHTTYKLDPTPARHTQYEGNRRFGLIPAAQRDRTVAEGRGPHHKGASEYMHVVNAAGHCQFVMMAANTANIPQWINMTTGFDMTREELLEVGERIANMRMAFEVREGGNPRQRQVPERMSGAVYKEGPHKDFGLDTETLEKEFLEACDWDPETCKPSAAKLESLGLADLVPVVHG
ncbi:MAG TPA: aldehyde ferredoxin oxidoreductase family protein [Dehalococcoidia bacterium]|nr:aldehyde ferredoxin oxidoreductase family protein [Dehalococcoidia bacterium]